ncbi:MAG: hypothetical protein LC130_09140 [Bryobacterales bacterium]|nr:hypothetical protein [Bryobacterales bacterium]
MSSQLATAAAYAGYLVLVWGVGRLLGLTGTSYILFGLVLSVLGALAAGAWLWFTGKFKQTPPARNSVPDSIAASGGSDELDVLFREAGNRLRSARVVQESDIRNVPAIIVIGGPGSAKTSTVLHCGLEPELLAGHVYQDNAVTPTRTANLWLSGRTVFVEAGGRLLGETSRWLQFIKRLQPGKLAAAFKSGGQAPRAVVVCLDSEVFTKPGASEAVTSMARNLHARLGDISQTLGISFPVYVLFTRADRLPFFLDYVRNLANEESGQVAGTTLTIRPPQSEGVYAEEETRRLTAAFERLFHSLCDKRIHFLARENDPAKLSGTYEFPREFRKIRTLAVQFLVDLCRPSQLRASPFLRGFYFSGVRPVLVSESAPVPAAPSQPERQMQAPATATQAFRVGAQQAPPQPAAQPVSGTRRVPQWLFLTHLFNDVILQDRAAMGASSSSVKSSNTRRFLLATASAAFLLLGVAFTVSFIGNRALENEVIEAARNLGTPATASDTLPSVESLRKLETLREAYARLALYERDGAPLRLRWGLYAGDDMYPHARRIYYDRFKRLLFGHTQTGMAQWLAQRPASPGANDDFGYAYDTLKAYLLTTYEHKRTVQSFLSPVLMNRWLSGRELDPERVDLARRQFDFYASELAAQNPYSSEADTGAIDRSRRYLAQFGGTESIYQFMLTESARNNPKVNFNEQFPGSAQVLVNNRDVSGAFTRGGWKFMQDALSKVDKFFGGEKWVLGDYASADIDRVKIEKDLRERYTNDYIARWREYLRNSTVLRYSNLKDAARKLNIHSSNQAPVLELLWLATQNTTVDSPRVSQAFDAVHKVVPPPATTPQFVLPPNANYVSALAGLQAAIEQAASQPVPNPAAVQQALSNATTAKLASKQIAATFLVDQEGKVHAMVQKLMEDPITQAEGLLQGLGPAELNGKAKGFCAVYGTLMRKYPFDSESRQQATLEEVNAIFQPKQGALWKFYESDLQQLLTWQGTQFVPAPPSPGGVELNPQFVAFLNRAAAFSTALYPAGSPAPQLHYTLAPQPTEGIQSLTLTIDGQSLTAGPRGGSPVKFTWPGAGTPQARMTGKLGGPDVQLLNYAGTWAAFQLFGEAQWQPSGAGYNLEWIPRTSGQPMIVNNKPLTIRFFLDMGGAPPFFRKGYFAGMQCVARAAR